VSTGSLNPHPRGTHRLLDPPNLLLHALIVLPPSLSIPLLLLPLVLQLASRRKEQEDGVDGLRGVLQEIGVERVEVLE
jgi:hypothetical protein